MLWFLQSPDISLFTLSISFRQIMFNPFSRFPERLNTLLIALGFFSLLICYPSVCIWNYVNKIFPYCHLVMGECDHCLTALCLQKPTCKEEPWRPLMHTRWQEGLTVIYHHRNAMFCLCLSALLSFGLRPFQRSGTHKYVFEIWEEMWLSVT